MKTLHETINEVNEIDSLKKEGLLNIKLFRNLVSKNGEDMFNCEKISQISAINTSYSNEFYYFTFIKTNYMGKKQKYIATYHNHRKDFKIENPDKDDVYTFYSLKELENLNNFSI